MTALDVIGPQALLAGLAPGSLNLVARIAGPVASDTGVALVATTDFAGCPADIDVLFVPGGDGTPAQMRDAATLAFLRDRAGRARWVTSVCTGQRVSKPLLLRPYQQDSTNHELAAETLALTKMNWNSTQFDGSTPITLKAARQVGRILKHVPQRLEVPGDYRYFI